MSVCPCVHTPNFHPARWTLVITRVFAILTLDLSLLFFFHPAQPPHNNFYRAFIHFHSIQAKATLRPLRTKMPTKWNWDATNSMQMLLLVIAEADVKPSTAIWTQVASKLGDITPGAVRYDQSGCSPYFACRHFTLSTSLHRILLIAWPGGMLTL
jgi:hypothetical protein